MSRQTRAEQLTEKIKRNATDMWAALEEMDRDRLYEDLGYKTQEDWALGEFGWNRTYIHYQVSAAKTALMLSQSVHNCEQMPTTESQIRPLAALPGPEQKAEAWLAAVELADGHTPTAKQVEAVVLEMTYKAPPPIPAGEFNVILADPPSETRFR
jgi:hypothetical protein